MPYCRGAASLAPCPYWFRFSRQALPLSRFLSCFIVQLSCLSALFSSTPFALDLLAIITNYPYLSSLTFLFVTCLVRLFGSESHFFASDVSGFTKCLQSFFPPASYTPFSHHQCIRCCGQHYQLQYLCHWNHGRILKSVSVPPSTRDAAFYPRRRTLPSLPIITQYFHGSSSPTRSSRHRPGSTLPSTEYVHHYCKRLRCRPRTTLSFMEHFYGRRTCTKPCG